jgi:hypothetical protein
VGGGSVGKNCGGIVGPTSKGSRVGPPINEGGLFMGGLFMGVGPPIKEGGFMNEGPPIKLGGLLGGRIFIEPPPYD